eukprot:GHRR01008588.1.p1 GENE.GHRR01008588.1~~GHRR01008588.1.p1  ORF type:complete len:135 (-),score=35.25 GHRR01008588.1:397-801(-)
MPQNGVQMLHNQYVHTPGFRTALAVLTHARQLTSCTPMKDTMHKQVLLGECQRVTAYVAQHKTSERVSSCRSGIHSGIKPCRCFPTAFRKLYTCNSDCIFCQNQANIGTLQSTVSTGNLQFSNGQCIPATAFLS